VRPGIDAGIPSPVSPEKTGIREVETIAFWQISWFDPS